MMKPSRIQAIAIVNWPCPQQQGWLAIRQSPASVASSDHIKGNRDRRRVTSQEQGAGHHGAIHGRTCSSGAVAGGPYTSAHCIFDGVTATDDLAFGWSARCGRNRTTSIVDSGCRRCSTRHTIHGRQLRVTFQIHKLRNRDRSQHTQNHDHHHQLNQSKAALYLFHVVHLVKIIKIVSEKFIQHLKSHQRLTDSQILVLQHLVVREVCGLSV